MNILLRIRRVQNVVDKSKECGIFIIYVTFIINRSKYGRRKETSKDKEIDFELC